MSLKSCSPLTAHKLPEQGGRKRRNSVNNHKVFRLFS